MFKSLVETFIATDTNSPYLQNSITAFNTLVSKENQLDASSCPSSQQDLSSKIDFQSFTTLLSSSDALHRARLLACTMPHANAWIRALPCHQKNFLCLEWTMNVPSSILIIFALLAMNRLWMSLVIMPLFAQ